MSKELASKGLLRLMMRLPVLRGELQVLHAHDANLRELAEAYGDATDMLEAMRSNSGAESHLVREYQTVCLEIEEEVVRQFAARRNPPR